MQAFFALDFARAIKAHSVNSMNASLILRFRGKPHESHCSRFTYPRPR